MSSRSLIEPRIPARSDGVIDSTARLCALVCDASQKALTDGWDEICADKKRTAMTVGSAAAMGLGMVYVVPKFRPLALIAESVGVGLTVTASYDFVDSGSAIRAWAAAKDTWQSADHYSANVDELSRCAGKFGFEFAMSSIGSAVGAGVGYRLCKSSKLPGVYRVDLRTPNSQPTEAYVSILSRQGRIARKTQDSVLNIRGIKPVSEQEGTGTGFFISSDGLIATANHVITGRADLRAYTAAHKELPLRVVAIDEANDLALLQVTNGKRFKPLKLAGDAPSVNDFMIAAGFPGASRNLTLSSGRYRKPLTLREMVERDNAELFPRDNLDRAQHSAELTVQGGNSGGPLLSKDGRVVGVITHGSLDGSKSDALDVRYVQELKAKVAASANNIREMELVHHSPRSQVVAGENRTFKVPKPEVGSQDLKLLFGDELLKVGASAVEPYRYTTHRSTLWHNGLPRDVNLVSRVQYRRSDHSLHIEPVIFDNKPIAEAAFSISSIASARARIALNKDAAPVSINMMNDPSRLLASSVQFGKLYLTRLMLGWD